MTKTRTNDLFERVPTWALAAFSVAVMASWPAFTYWADLRNKAAASGGSICRAESAAHARLLDFWRANRVVRDVRTGDGVAVVEVDTDRWRQVRHQEQVSIAIAGYCSVADASGSGTAFVRGSLQEDLGSVVDGNWIR